MKQFILIMIASLFVVSTGFSQVYNVYIGFSGTCDCQGTTAENYYKVTISIYDSANDEYIIEDQTEHTDDATATGINIPVGAVQTYCGQIHQETPSLTLSVDVWLMETCNNPETVCCSGSCSSGPDSCQDYYDGTITCPVTLN